MWRVQTLQERADRMRSAGATKFGGIGKLALAEVRFRGGIADVNAIEACLANLSGARRSRPTENSEPLISP